MAPVRLSVFFLAFLSFACLLGQFYGYWTMHSFGTCVLLPSTTALILFAWWWRGSPAGLNSPRTWIIQGALAGIVAALAYDLYRLPFVLSGAPLFSVFPRFGELLLGATEPRWLVHTLGWSYHFSNGAALGIMFLAGVSAMRRPPFFAGAVLWALFVEGVLLVTRYADFFGFPRNARFLFLTATAHVIFGLVLGWYLRRHFSGRLPIRKAA